MPTAPTDPAESAASRPTARLAILGSGQLAYFMAAAARRLGSDCTVIAPEAQAPAQHTASHYEQHALTDAAWLGDQAARGQTLTFDFEAIPAPSLDALIAHGDAATRLQAAVLRRLQNKLQQKQWLAAEGFPTPAFVPLQIDGAPTAAQLEQATSLGLPVAQKLATGGYDGRGVQILKDPTALTTLWPGESYLEAFVPRMQELTVIAARALDGRVAAYDPAATYFDAEGQCLDYWIAPAPVPGALLKRAALLAKDIVAALGGVGVYAIELFAAEDGALLVNEISARVHNAGHHTIEGNRCSQFEQHVRAVLGQPFGAFDTAAPVTVAQNLLAGRHAVETLLGGAPGIIRRGAATLHWYGKTTAPHLRKMGHVTATGDDSSAAQAAIATLLASLSAGQLTAEDLQPLTTGAQT
ncbi:MAG: ATP-grasp domain-containing protein [Pseudomonadota bacterium]